MDILLNVFRLSPALLSIAAALSAVIGVILSKYVPGGILREKVNRWRPALAVIVGTSLGLIVAWLSSATLLVVLISILSGYFFSRPPEMGLVSLWRGWRLRRLKQSLEAFSGNRNSDFRFDQMVFREDWNIRPRFETGEEGRFVGREELLGRLSSHFISHGGGTILISGVRGVGKTALVDRALVDARQKLCDRYWIDVWDYLKAVRGFRHPVLYIVRRTLLRLGSDASDFDFSTTSKPPSEKLKHGAAEYTRQRARGFLKRLNPVGNCIRHMQEAASWQLFVLKFSASDISGAMAQPGEKIIGRPKIDPEKLLRSVIRKLYMTCHSSRREIEDEARILGWSLSNKAERQRFFDTLEGAYNKSVSKSYSEVVSNRINEYAKQSQTVVSERKINIARAIGLLMGIGLYAGGAWLLKKFPSFPVSGQIVSAVAGGIAAYLTWSWASKRSSEKGSDRAREARFSYEYDYSLERMQRDLESLMQTLQPSRRSEFHPFRCFTRSAVIFDELDKLEDADKQLDDVITHFKNFFTLSETVFVFLADHTFYEHLNRETAKAQLDRHYSAQHTFFTEKIYLRKPDFRRFQEAFYRFTDPDWIVTRARSKEAPPDPGLTEYLLSNDRSDVVRSLRLETLTQLFINRGKYNSDQQKEIEEAFEEQKGLENPVSLAHIWASQASAKAAVQSLQQIKKDFYDKDGWKNSDAVSYLYYFRQDFEEDEKTITDNYERLGHPSLAKYDSVKEIEFSLSDLAYALCFQTRNHYFDLYQMVYDYVGSYANGAPILFLDSKRFAQETRLASRYQQLLEIAFDSVKENHPSREYFNGLVMESLYRVFDKRAVGQSVAISEILLPLNGVTNSDKTPSARKKVKVDGATMTGRDIERINQAILVLLRLALVHKAISPASPNLATLLKPESVDWKALAQCKFKWNDDIQPIIRVVDRETHEDKLIDFWNQHGRELDALDSELAELWSGVSITDDGAKLRSLIGELRSKAESVRLKSVKISSADASALKANVGTTQTRNALMPRIILDRIRVEGDAFILDGSGTQSPELAGSSTPPKSLENQMRLFQSATKTKPVAIISPINTDAIFYFVAGPFPVNMDENWTFLQENDFVFWLGSVDKDKKPTEERIRFYSVSEIRPSARDLFANYRERARSARLRRVRANWEASGFADVNLAERYGAETVGPIEKNGTLPRAISTDAVLAAITSLNKTREEFQLSTNEAWNRYGIDQLGPMDTALEKLADRIVSQAEIQDPSHSLLPEIKRALEQATDYETSAIRPYVWIRVFLSVTSHPNVLARLLVSEITKDTVGPAFSSLPLDEEPRRFLTEAFASWLTRTLEAHADNQSLTLQALLSMPEWPAEIEAQRRLLTLSPLAPVRSVRTSSRLRRKATNDASTTTPESGSELKPPS